MWKVYVITTFLISCVDLEDYKSSAKLQHLISKREIDYDDGKLITPLLIQKYGYPAETHQIITSDGYNLNVHRIPFGKQSPPCLRKNKMPVLLVHDIISSSSDFVINGPNMSLGYLLADAGYDVWMLNARGNRYSRTHQTLTPQRTNFWDFTFHEIGYYDLPATIDYILKATGQQNIFYIGHSMGSTVYYVLMSEHPAYNNKIKAAFHMSPVVYLTHMKSPVLNFFSYFSNTIGLLLDIIGVGEFLPKFEWLFQLGQFICKGGDPTQPICTNVLFLCAGFNPNNLDYERFPIYMGHTPGGGSTRTFIHYGQLAQSGVFRKYNLGIVRNLLNYNSIKPPMYNLHNIKSPVYLIHSLADWFNDPKDVNNLYRQLPPGTATKITIEDSNFAHVDFFIGKNVKEMVYNNIIDIMKNLV